MRHLLVACLLAATVLAQQPPAAAPAQLTVKTIFAPGGLTGPAPQNVQFSPDGTKVSYILRDDSGERGELWYVDIASGKKAVLVSESKLAKLAPPFDRLSEREKERRTRYSVAQYYWAPDSQHILFDALGQFWLYRLDTGTAVQITSSPERSGDPRFSPDGSRFAFIRKHNLFVADREGAGLRQLTHDTEDDILNGEVDWIYAEELDVRHNYFWLPDGRQILFLQMNESAVPTYPIADLIPTQPTVDMQKYPKPGDPNPQVRLGVVNVNGGKVRWLQVPVASGDKSPALSPAHGFYIPRFGWVRPGIAWVEVLNRAQDRLDLYFVAVEANTARLVLSERSPTWVEVNDNFAVVGADRFLWTSWRDGHTHLYLYSFNGADPTAGEAKLEAQLTRGEFEVFDVGLVDEAAKLVYFTANAGDDRQRQLFRAHLDGSGFEQVSREPGTHEPTFAGSGKLYIDKFSTIMSPPRLSLCRVNGDGACAAFWESRSMAAYNLAAPQFVDFRAEGGTVLHGSLIMPPDISAGGKIPLVLYPYGGPGEQQVRDTWGGNRFLFNQVLAQEGIAVLSVDNRGMAGRGRAFASAVRGEFGKTEIQDQLAALGQALERYPALDKDRVGFWGWSYGGCMTLWALTRTTAFKAGVAVAPVGEWRDYDSIYTERYLGLPQENAEGYRRSSPLTTAGDLHGSLLLVHGTGDDNVHLQNTVQMTEALIDAGKRFQLMLYPRKLHSISGTAAQTDLFTRMQEHFERELLGRP
ncbi:MAG TPA: DPP IV N-terminal domain-containing protein [Terriglobales bacterium]|nr:DPP IV N-terminal domain-containing protein [Terriglobales bacterium]